MRQSRFWSGARGETNMKPETPTVATPVGVPKDYDVIIQQGHMEIRLTMKQARYVASQLLQVAPILEPEGEE